MPRIQSTVKHESNVESVVSFIKLSLLFLFLGDELVVVDKKLEIPIRKLDRVSFPRLDIIAPEMVVLDQ